MPFHVMIIPTLSCPSNCKYCWGSENTSEVMDIEIVKEISQWLNGFKDDYVHFTFHGGEPLIPGYDFYSKALPLLKEVPKQNGFSIQSNLWLLDEKLAELFKEYDVSLSTSIDGPKEINDYQRGEGYFDKTIKAIEIAEEHDINVNYVCTFTSYSKDFKDEIYEFFKSRHASLKMHAALPSLRGDNADPWALKQSEHGQLLIDLLDKYLYDLEEFTIKDFDHIAKSSFIRRGTLCTFADCIGTTLAVGYDGSIYPCYRFVGMPDYIMGNDKDKPSMEELESSDAFKKLNEFREFVKEDCKDCTFMKFCLGGCPYNGIVASHSPKAVDPQCDAYKMIFGEVSKRANKEMLKSALPGMGPKKERKEGEPYSIMDLMMKR